MPDSAVFASAAVGVGWSAVPDELHAHATDAVVQYLDSFTRPGPGRTLAVERAADAIHEAARQPVSAGAAWVLVEAWQTAHRVVDGPYDDDPPCPCADHSPGSRATLGNLAVLLLRCQPVLSDLTPLTQQLPAPAPPTAAALTRLGEHRRWR